MCRGYATSRGEGSKSDCDVETFLACGYPSTSCQAYWRTDSNQFLFQLAIQIAKRTKLALVPLQLGSLYARLESASKTSAIQSDVVTNAGSSYLQMFQLGRFSLLAPKQ